MDLNKIVIALFAIFCIALFVGVVSASEDAGFNSTDNSSNTTVDETGLNDVSDWTEYGNTTDALNATSSTNSTAGNFTGNATGNITGNVTGNLTNATNATNATTHHGLLSTGNPILILLGVCTVIGSYIIRRE